MEEDNNNQPNDQPNKKLNPWQVVASVLAASFGVQSSKNRERDFKEGSFKSFVVAGILFTVFFIGVLYLIVSTVLENVR